jgi:hypothetical protein
LLPPLTCLNPFRPSVYESGTIHIRSLNLTSARLCIKWRVSGRPDPSPDGKKIRRWEFLCYRKAMEVSNILAIVPALAQVPNAPQAFADEDLVNRY